MVPNIPVSVWEQISIVIVFAFLLAGLGWVLVRLFTQAIADVNAHYAQLIKDTNQQWQQYFDARTEASGLVSRQMLERVEAVAGTLAELVSGFAEHDRQERETLAQFGKGRERAAKTARKEK